MELELVEVLHRGETILERDRKVSKTIQERTRELIQDGDFIAQHARGRAATDAV